ncbi:MAG: ABC transporter permease [Thermoleophilaceae bacterium]|nr:ABC transporter permease [Thermoleophilaceae bacterium]
MPAAYSSPPARAADAESAEHQTSAFEPDGIRRTFGRVVSSRAAASAGIWVATGLLFLVSWIVQPQSVSHSSLLGMLPFAAVLAIAAIGQTLVIQQGGIDLSVPGLISLTVVIVTRYPNGDSGKLLAALLLSLAVAIAAGAVTGLIVSRIGITPIVATLGMNALLYGGVLEISGGTPRTTTRALHSFASSRVAGIPTTVVIAVVVTAAVAFLVKKTVGGRRFEAVGAGLVGARAAGIEAHRHQVAAYVGATLMYWVAGVLLAGVVSTPSAFQGDSYLLPSVAAVVLGGTSLLGGRGSVVASAVAALFVSQLDQLVLTTGAKDAVQNLVQAGVLAIGIAIYSVPWSRLREWLRSEPRRRGEGAALQE